MTLTESTQRPVALAMADEGRVVRVVGLRAGRNLDRRLTDLGLNVGSELIVLQRQGGGLLIRRGEARIALGSSMATKIMVVPLDAQARDAPDI
jgi:ferrous iron transport protein A